MKTLLLILLILPLLAAAQFKPIAHLEANDPDGTEVTWKITAGDPAGYFHITPCSGVIKLDSSVYSTFTRQRTFTITFTCTDETGLSSKTIRKITLYKTKQPDIVTKL